MTAFYVMLPSTKPSSVVGGPSYLHRVAMLTLVT